MIMRRAPGEDEYAGSHLDTHAEDALCRPRPNGQTPDLNAKAPEMLPCKERPSSASPLPQPVADRLTFRKENQCDG